jgi:tRNA pseudouridine38-40 synthase
VHAAGQVAHLRTTSTIPTNNLLRAVRSRLPDDITLVRVAEVPRQFHATQSAVSKLYRYRIWNDRAKPVEHLVERYTYHFWKPLDITKMQEAARHFVGQQGRQASADDVADGVPVRCVPALSRSTGGR